MHEFLLPHVDVYHIPPRWGGVTMQLNAFCTALFCIPMEKVKMMRGSFSKLAKLGYGALALAAVAGVSFVSLSEAQAATATATLSVSASISGACTVGGAALSFGAYSAASASTSNSTIQVTCTNGTNAVVSLNQGANNNRVPSAGSRALANAGNYLGYEIYTDNALATVWNPANAPTISSVGSPISLTAYGRIPAGQNPATGSYNDTVTITVTF